MIIGKTRTTTIRRMISVLGICIPNPTISCMTSRIMTSFLHTFPPLCQLTPQPHPALLSDMRGSVTGRLFITITTLLAAQPLMLPATGVSEQSHRSTVPIFLSSPLPSPLNQTFRIAFQTKIHHAFQPTTPSIAAIHVSNSASLCFNFLLVLFLLLPPLPSIKRVRLAVVAPHFFACTLFSQSYPSFSVPPHLSVLSLPPLVLYYT